MPLSRAALYKGNLLYSIMIVEQQWSLQQRNITVEYVVCPIRQVKEMVPDMELAQRSWVAISNEDPAAAAGIMQTVKERNMAPWYAHLSHHHPALFPLDAELLSKMKEANEVEAKRISEV